MAQIIVINSVNNGSGKTLLAAHLAVMLARDYKTAVMDNVGDSSPLALFVAKRYNLNLGKNYMLPVPEYHSLRKETLAAAGDKYDVVLLDSPDAKYFKYADIFITPLSGREGLNAVANPKSMYASLLWNARKSRAADGKSTFRWVVVPNDDYTGEDYKQLSEAGKFLGFSVAQRWINRAAYADGLKRGVTVLDKDQPALKTLFDFPDLYARRDLKKLADFIWQNK